MQSAININSLVDYAEGQLREEDKASVELKLLEDPVQLQIARGLLMLKRDFPERDLGAFLEEREKKLKRQIYEKICKIPD